MTKAASKTPLLRLIALYKSVELNDQGCLAMVQREFGWAGIGRPVAGALLLNKIASKIGRKSEDKVLQAIGKGTI
jgi:hypothetical protein